MPGTARELWRGSQRRHHRRYGVNNVYPPQEMGAVISARATETLRISQGCPIIRGSWGQFHPEFTQPAWRPMFISCIKAALNTEAPQRQA